MIPFRLIRRAKRSVQSALVSFQLQQNAAEQYQQNMFYSDKKEKDWPAVTGRADVGNRSHEGQVPPLDLLRHVQDPVIQSQFEYENESEVVVDNERNEDEGGHPRDVEPSTTFQPSPNLDILGQLNPELAYAIMAEQETHRQSLKQRLQVLYEERAGKPLDITSKTALLSLQKAELELECRKCGIPIPETKEQAAEVLRLTVMRNELSEYRGEYQNLDDPEVVEKTYMNIFGTKYDDNNKQQDKETEQETGESGYAATFEQITQARFQYKQVFTADEVASMLLKAKMEEVVVMDLRGRCDWADYFVIGSGRSLRHIYAAAYAVFYSLKQKCKEVAPGQKPRVEGSNGLPWLLVDCGSVIAHCFMHQDREYYNLEELWREEANEIYGVRDPEAEKVLTIDTIQTNKMAFIEAGQSQPEQE